MSTISGPYPVVGFVWGGLLDFGLSAYLMVHLKTKSPDFIIMHRTERYIGRISGILADLDSLKVVVCFNSL